MDEGEFGAILKRQLNVSLTTKWDRVWVKERDVCGEELGDYCSFIKTLITKRYVNIGKPEDIPMALSVLPHVAFGNLALFISFILTHN